METITMESKEIKYEIAGFSTFSSSFRPENIKCDNPNDPSSRWSSELNDQKQYITIKLPTEALVTKLYFGKFSKIHVCNLKKMDVYSFMYKTETSFPFMNSQKFPQKIFEGGLHNDTTPEIICVDYIKDDTFILSRYLKICPRSAYGPNFNYSIWHLKVYGITDKNIITNIIQYNATKINFKCYKIIQKFLRNQNNFETIKSLEKEGIQLEKDCLKELKKKVIENDLTSVREIIKKNMQNGDPFKEYVSNGGWKTVNILKNTMWPPSRGGHACCIFDNKIFIHGGWNGKEELNDFWIFNCLTNTWKKCPVDLGYKSCHEMVIYENKIIIIGGYVKTITNDSKAKFYEIDIETLKINEIKVENAPKALYDTQSVVVGKKIYIFGGKTNKADEIQHSGLCYIEDNNFIEVDTDSNVFSKLKKRVGHNLIYYENNKKFDVEKINDPKYIYKMTFPRKSLLIIGGQNNKILYQDITFYNLEEGTIYKTVKFPFQNDKRVINRSFLHKHYLYIIFYYEKDKEGVLDQHVMYVYDLVNNTWNNIIFWSFILEPRSAHSFVYNKTNMTMYIFGGNRHGTKNKFIMNDMNLLKLPRVLRTEKEIDRKLDFFMNKIKFLKLCNENTLEALKFLQNDLFDSFGGEKEESYNDQELERLVIELFKPKTHDPIEKIMLLINTLLDNDENKIQNTDMYEFLSM